MYKYARLIDKETGFCEVGIGTNIEYYKSIGMTEMDVTKSEVDNNWYLTEKLLTEEYEIQKQNLNKENQKLEIQITLDELDKKRIRALCEPEVKDKKTGETWLDYYNNQILLYRKQLDALS